MNYVPAPLPYHRAIVQHLRSEEPGLWQWFSSSRQGADEQQAVRLDLLKSTYRLDAGSKPHLQPIVEEVRERMRLHCQITVYQALAGNGLNAALAYLPGEAHIILTGPLASVLSEIEARAVLAHELAHYHLFEEAQGDYLTAGNLLRSLSADPAAGAAAADSARLYRLWAEIYADRWACYVSQDFKAAVAALVKTETGLAEVSAEDYLRQADEIFANSNVRAEDHLSHPELFIRARAVRLWSEQGDEAHAEIERMIEGGLNLDRLDLLGQKRAADLTRRFLQTLLQPSWRRTEATLAHARRFFPEFAVEAASGDDDDSLKSELERSDPSLTDYLCYLMLDFTTVDRDLGDEGLAAALVRSRRLGIEKRFTEIAQKELTLSKKTLARVVQDAEATIAKLGATRAT